MKEDPAQALYAKKSKSLDLEKTVDNFAMWGFGLTFGQIVLLGMWFLYPLFFAASVVGIVLGFVGLQRIKKDKKLKGRGFAIAGIILGFLQILGYIILTFFILAGAFTS